jgi:hypothetical protein
VELKGINKDPKYAWPFNTRWQGYSAIYQYCKLLEIADDDAVKSRAGKHAAAMLRIGTGRERLIECLRPFTYAQLDYHKVDSKCVLVCTNDAGVEIVHNVARWYFGMLVEENSSGILGAHVAFELNPSADAALETVESALSPIIFDTNDPRIRYCEGGKVFLLQIAEGLDYQSFAVLKVDNGWANIAKDVIDNVMGTVGCAICFGTPRAWAQRDLIEKIFGQLSRAGLQRLRSTTGSGPTDPRRDEPDEAAAEDRISLSDIEAIIYGCIQAHNHSSKLHTQYASPVQHVEALAKSKKNGFVYAPLPQATINDMRLMWHTREVVVVANNKKGIRPHFTIDGITHRNVYLASAWHLVGKTLIARVNRRCARIVTATVAETGEDLGYMLVSGAWARSDISYRDRKLITSGGKTLQKGLPLHRPMDNFFDQKNQSRPSQTEALAAGKREIEKQRATHLAAQAEADAIYRSGTPAHEVVPLPEPIVPVDIGTFDVPLKALPAPQAQELRPTGDPFGLLHIPTTKSTRR